MHEQKRKHLVMFERAEEGLLQKERQLVFDVINQSEKSTSEANVFLQKVIDFLVETYDLNFIGAFLINADTKFADFVVGTGKAGELLSSRGHRWPLGDLDTWKAIPPVREAILSNGICFEMLGLIPFEGFFFCGLSSNYKDKTILPIQFVESASFSAPLIAETKINMILPLRTFKGIIGALEFHTPSVYMGKGSAIFILPIADYIAEIYLEKLN